jgi:hypothetical protein
MVFLQKDGLLVHCLSLLQDYSIYKSLLFKNNILTEDLSHSNSLRMENGFKLLLTLFFHMKSNKTIEIVYIVHAIILNNFGFL